jgi:PKD repeat protein
MKRPAQIVSLILILGLFACMCFSCTSTCSTENHKPIAYAGDNQQVDLGDTAQLDGSGSSDEDGDTLTYQWAFDSRPDGSNAALSDATIVNPTFEVDVSGTYTVQLIVNDGEEDSSPDSVIITTEELPQSIIIDHQCADLGAIPDSALSAAVDTRIMVRHASVGSNINEGLDEIYNSNNKYDRSNWDFQDRGNPGWEAKLDDLVDETASQLGSFDVFTMKFCYIDYDASWDDYRNHMEQLEADYPDKKFVWWTMPITDAGYASHDAFNASVRSYCEDNGKILFDIADIECHSPSGVKQTDGGHEILYDDYTDDGGHLNETGREQVASAFWYMMARIAGWDGTTE